jgi:predicted metal-binding membrane protein
VGLVRIWVDFGVKLVVIGLYKFSLLKCKKVISFICLNNGTQRRYIIDLDVYRGVPAYSKFTNRYQLHLSVVLDASVLQGSVQLAWSYILVQLPQKNFAELVRRQAGHQSKAKAKQRLSREKSQAKA